MMPSVSDGEHRGARSVNCSPFWRFVRADERGAAMVEFAIVAAVIFIPLVFGIIEFGRLVWSKTMVTAAAREGVRYAMVRGSSSGAPADDSATIATYVKGRTQLTPIVVRPSWTGTKAPGDTATVQVSFTYTPIVPVISAKTLTSTSKQIISF